MKMMDKSTISVVIVLALATVVSFIGEPQGFEESSQAVWPLIIGGLISLGSSIAGAAIGNKKAKQAALQQQAAYNEAWANYEDWYQEQMNTNILDRADTLSMLKRYRDWQEEDAKKYQTNAIKGGASEEAKIAYAQQANKGYADAISRIAAMGQQYKDRLSQNYATTRLNFKTRQADMAAQGGVQSAQAVASGIANAGGTLGGLIGGINWGGGQSSVVPTTVPATQYAGVDLDDYGNPLY